MKKQTSAHELSFELFISEKEIAEKTKELGQHITRLYKGKKPLFIGVMNGAFVFAADLIRHCHLECEIAFVRLSSYKGTKSSGKIETVYGLEMDIVGRHIIVVEDIVDSGRTLHYFLKYLREQNPASVSLTTLLFKPDALRFPLKLDHVGFEIPEKFVIGYGLDYDGIG
ncbi:MAG TPA: hypoxanthine phosphoribosyltransferase, partial [Bacteroidetes bacterium]|nr:hypoxanthine phosphoribosyltransferase [Bacteroidota bacterium]